MKHLILIIAALSLFSCKKDYACYGEERLEYRFTKEDNNGFTQELERTQEFNVVESCINCSKKDKDKLLQIILDFLIRQETEYEEVFIEDGYEVDQKTILESVIICEEQV